MVMSGRWGGGLVLALALAVFAGVVSAGTAEAAAPTVRVDLRCNGPDGPRDVRACLDGATLEVGRAGIITIYQTEDVVALGDPSTGHLSLSLPKDFRVRAQNRGADTRLSLTVAAPSGKTVYEAAAGHYEWVQYTHCGPQVEPTCRQYNYGKDGRVRPRYSDSATH
ncbi:hypothetical protein F1188_14330 [Roseospira marina]|uniref:Uncharacterized protein n=1 Tax=Roseospira marina TaxID=140057 RepID=A0A5M6IA08_9PROT|nr:hypothetical protein [Roseospira marina]KAA5604787.1 hypothetical protein F1188_14330 [Roseospira marina]MBB4313471.1 hypothetical protein [Roseospira marina]MBB5086633.1 hypothetical protein [Roseospira marina]